MNLKKIKNKNFLKIFSPIICKIKKKYIYKKIYNKARNYIINLKKMQKQKNSQDFQLYFL